MWFYLRSYHPGAHRTHWRDAQAQSASDRVRRRMRTPPWLRALPEQPQEDREVLHAAQDGCRYADFVGNSGDKWMHVHALVRASPGQGLGSIVTSPSREEELLMQLMGYLADGYGLSVEAVQLQNERALHEWDRPGPFPALDGSRGLRNDVAVRRARADSLTTARDLCVPSCTPRSGSVMLPRRRSRRSRKQMKPFSACVSGCSPWSWSWRKARWSQPTVQALDAELKQVRRSTAGTSDREPAAKEACPDGDSRSREEDVPSSTAIDEHQAGSIGSAAAKTRELWVNSSG